MTQNLMNGIADGMLPTVSHDVRLINVSDSSDESIIAVVGTSHFAVSEPLARLLDFLRESRSADEASSFLSQTLGRPISAASATQFIQDRVPADFFRGDQASQAHPFDLRRDIISAEIVSILARPFVLLLHPAMMTAVVVACAVMLWRSSSTFAMVVNLNFGSLGILTLLALCAGTAFLHELGHAAACLRAKRRPGSIGMAFYYGLPVFYCDVSIAWTCGWKDRMLIGASGLLVDAAVVAVTCFVGSLTHWAMWYGLALARLLAMFVNLNLGIKSDAYWVLSDLLGVRDLHAVLALRPQSWRSASIDVRIATVLTVLSTVIFAGLFIAVVASLAGYAYNYLSHDAQLDVLNLVSSAQAGRWKDAVDHLIDILNSGLRIVVLGFIVWAISERTLKRAKAAAR